ncbi:MAG: NepR family anti-sigma factor [Sphingomonadales bacterium]
MGAGSLRQRPASFLVAVDRPSGIVRCGQAAGMVRDNVLVERPAAERSEKDRGQQPKSGRPKPPMSSPSDVGSALRKAFQSAVEEDVPDELLDLLRRLD